MDKDLATGGGIEKSIVTIIELLNQNGCDVYLLSLNKPRLGEIKRIYGKKIRLKEVYAPKLIKTLPNKELIYQFVALPLLIKMLQHVEFILAVDCYFMLNFIPRSYPFLVYELSVPYLPKNFLKRSIRCMLFKISKPRKNIPIIAHSRFTGKQIWEVFGMRTAGTLYPPISNYFFNCEARNKRNQIVHVGRFSPDKRIELSLYIMREVLEKSKDAVLYLIGASSGKKSKRYISHLKEIAEDLKISDNIIILEDVDIENLVKILKESKIILSFQTEPESFNMSILEGMAAGCVPIVPKVRRGAWDEILDEGKYGFGFNTISECAEVIIHLLNLNSSEFHNYSCKAIRRAQLFDEYAFKQNFLRILQNMGLKKLCVRVW
ncbi:MAG: glycosyltransferase family 4 protein [Candidatus Bathyarchaeia archaeon]